MNKNMESNYIEVLGVIKTRVATNILQAVADGVLKIDKEEVQRLVSVINSSIDNAGFDGLGMLKRLK